MDELQKAFQFIEQHELTPNAVSIPDEHVDGIMNVDFTLKNHALDSMSWNERQSHLMWMYSHSKEFRELAMKTYDHWMDQIEKAKKEALKAFDQQLFSNLNKLNEDNQ